MCLTIANLSFLTCLPPGQCIQFGAINQATGQPFCIPYKSPSGPLAYFYQISYFPNGTTVAINSANSLLVPGKPSITAVFPFSAHSGQIIKSTSLPSSNPSNAAACLQVVPVGIPTLSYVANITKRTGSNGLNILTYTESGIYNIKTQQLLNSCSGYKSNLFCTTKYFNYQCNMTIAVGATGR